MTKQSERYLGGHKKFQVTEYRCKGLETRMERHNEQLNYDLLQLHQSMTLTVSVFAVVFLHCLIQKNMKQLQNVA